MFTLIPTYHQLGEEIHMHTVYNEISPYLLMELPLYYWNVCRFLTDTVVINTCNRIIKRFRNIVNLYKLKYKKKQPKKQKQTKTNKKQNRKPLIHVYPNNLKKKKKPINQNYSINKEQIFWKEKPNHSHEQTTIRSQFLIA